MCVCVCVCACVRVCVCVCVCVCCTKKKWTCSYTPHKTHNGPPRTNYCVVIHLPFLLLPPLLPFVHTRSSWWKETQAHWTEEEMGIFLQKHLCDCCKSKGVEEVEKACPDCYINQRKTSQVVCVCACVCVHACTFTALYQSMQG